MRIIAGFYKGRKLHTLEGLTTRPMLESTKGAIFSSLGGYLTEMTVLDLFGGSGNLSLEALSRGAKVATIVEANSEAIKIIEKNATILQDPKTLNIIQSDYMAVLNKLKQPFDLIFLDPPFRLKIIDDLVETIIEKKLLRSGGFIVAQYPTVDVVSKVYEGLTVKLCRRYASSEVLILEKE